MSPADETGSIPLPGGGPGGEQIFELLLRSSAEALALTRMDSTLVEVSDKFVQLAGYPREELVGRTWTSLGLVPPEILQHARAVLNARGAIRRVEADLRTKSGALRHIEFSTDVLRTGAESYLLTAVRNLSGGNSSAEALRAVEAGYRDLFENAATGIAHVHADGRLLEVNRTWARVLGYDSPEQYIAEVVSARNIYEDPAQREEFLAALRAEGIVRGFEALLRHRDGTRVWASLDARAVTDENGELVGIHASGLDITERKRAEQALRESEARFRSIFVHSLDGILLTGEDGMILAANPAACALLGCSEKELLRMDLDAVLDLSAEPLTAVLPTAGNQPARAELQMRRLDGSTFPAEITRSTFEDADGARKTSLIVRDVSERRRADDELRRAKAEADAANSAKSEFLSRMSHELRTPLNAILGFAQLLDMDPDPDGGDEVRHIIRAGRHLLALINEVLDISRIESGNLALSPEPVLVSDLVEEAVSLISPLAAARSIRVAIHEPAGCNSYVHADRQRTKQILLNLLSNAIKYNHEGGTVTVTCSPGDLDTGSSSVLEVTDTGIGIPAADLHRLFIPFERLGAVATEIEGTGVGLALSQRLARLMGGDIAVASEVGQGSTFRLILPVSRRPDEQVSPAAGTPSAEVPVPRPGLTVLSIEDNTANTRLVEQILARRPGWQLRASGQGQLGLDLALAEPPDLVLLDLHLPDMNGAEVLRRLKAHPATQDVPVAIVSADATPKHVDHLRASGADAYFTKPIDVRELLAYLDLVSGRGNGKS